jgi:hypothetical protein
LAEALPCAFHSEKPGPDFPLRQSSQYDILAEAVPPELELLLRAIRPVEKGEVEADNVIQIQRLAGQSLEWDYLATLADRHRVSPLLISGLKRTAWFLIPDDVKTAFNALHSENLKRNFRLSHHASRVTKAFGEEGIRIIPFKGVFLAQSFYGQVSSREVSDIDILVDQQDVSRSHTLLASMGFEPVETLDQEQVFRDSELQVEIDLHWQLTPAFFPVNFEFGQIWQRTVPADIGGVSYRSLAAEDLLLVLSVQVAKDSWERLQRLEQLQKVCDIAALIRQRPELDWEMVAANASGLGLSRVLHLALLLCVRLLGTVLPPVTMREVGSDGKAMRLAIKISDATSLAQTIPAPASNSLLDYSLRLRQLVYYLNLRERPVDKWQHIGRVLKAMTVMEISS